MRAFHLNVFLTLHHNESAKSLALIIIHLDSYKIFDVAFKQQVLDYLEADWENVSEIPQLKLRQIAIRFGVPCKSLKRWIEVGSARRPGGGRKEIYPELSSKVYEWYKLHPSATPKMIKEKALELCGDPNFKASNGWLNKFYKKYQIGRG